MAQKTLQEASQKPGQIFPVRNGKQRFYGRGAPGLKTLDILRVMFGRAGRGHPESQHSRIPQSVLRPLLAGSATKDAAVVACAPGQELAARAIGVMDGRIYATGPRLIRAQQS
jgi:hypothetical protein